MVQDFLIDDTTGDLLIRNGDFVIGESDEQHIDHLLSAIQGDYPLNILLGVGIGRYVNAPIDLNNANTLMRNIRVQAALDNLTINTLKANADGSFDIDGEYV